jgi:TPR repeat protein
MTRKTIRVLFSSFCPLLLLSVLWMFIGDGDESNLERANAATKRGAATAEYFLARAYFQGKGVAQDYRKAAELFRRAAQQGNAPAQNDLGVMFESGLGARS